eukprot:scaffold23504_cov32-Tisochrysis_lutea.AAC.5
MSELEKGVATDEISLTLTAHSRSMAMEGFLHTIWDIPSSPPRPALGASRQDQAVDQMSWLDKPSRNPVDEPKRDMGGKVGRRS